MWCFAAATVEMLPSSAYAQVGRGGMGVEERWVGVGVAKHGCQWYLLILTHLWESESKGQKEHFSKTQRERSIRSEGFGWCYKDKVYVCL